MHETDLALVRRARRGDETAFHELVDRFAGELFGLAVALVGDAADAEDVVQETLLGVVRGLSRFAARSSVRTWLMRICVRQAARRLRGRGARPTVPIDPVAEARPEAMADRRTTGVEAVDARIDVHDLLRTLSPEHREVIALRELEGLSYDEIASVLRIPRGTVESRLHRARQALRGRLGSYLA